MAPAAQINEGRRAAKAATTPLREATFNAPSRTAGHKVTPRGAAAREQILKAALAVLSDGGYAALSISNVCKKASASGASLYHHFGDKAGLINAMIEYAVEENDRIFTAALSAKTTPLEQIDTFIATLRKVRKQRTSNASAVMMALSQAHGDSPDAAAVIAKAQPYIQSLIARKFAEILELEDADLLAHLHLGFSSYSAQLAQSGGTGADIDAVLDSLRRVLLITVAALRPDYLNDPNFSAAVSAAASSSKSTKMTKEV